MDLSFLQRARFSAAGLVPIKRTLGPDLAELVAAAAAHQSASPTARILSIVLADEGGAEEQVHGLARLLAPRRFGTAGAANLAGSFNPLIARQLMVGQVE